MELSNAVMLHLCVCQVYILRLLPEHERVANVLFTPHGSHVFCRWVERTGSAAKTSYQRKRCPTTAVKTFSSALSLSSLIFLAFSCCGVWWRAAQSSGGASYCWRLVKRGIWHWIVLVAGVWGCVRAIILFLYPHGFISKHLQCSTLFNCNNKNNLCALTTPCIIFTLGVGRNMA